ncbi:unnamed protein product, partial [Prorocentrum cordatum]
KDIVGNSTRLSYGNVYADLYARKFEDAVRTTETLGDQLDNVVLSTTYDATTHTSQMLHQVSRIIATRTVRSAERDLFFVSMCCYDTHNTEYEELQGRYTELNAALQGFVAEMKGQGIYENIVVVTSSDFGRTLTSNGRGTDHGWAGHGFVLGGTVHGGKSTTTSPRL